MIDAFQSGIHADICRMHVSSCSAVFFYPREQAIVITGTMTAEQAQVKNGRIRRDQPLLQKKELIIFTRPAGSHPACYRQVISRGLRRGIP